MLLTVLMTALMAGCTAGSGDGLDASGRPVGEGGNIPLEATLASIQANVFNPSCIVCHAGAAAPLGLRLDKDNSFTHLVGVSSRQDGSLLRVDPGDPDASYLIRKLEGSASTGEQMPVGGPPIPQATIDVIRLWISNGAPPDDTGSADVAPTVVSLTPAPDSSGPDFPAEIVAGFSQDMDASTINALTFTLQRAGGDGQFGDGNEVDIIATSVALSAVNQRLAIMDLSDVPAVADRYRATIFGSGPNVILGINALALDGEYLGAFPSGDGNEGGDFVVEFDIQGVAPTLASIQENVFTPSCALSGCHSGPSGPSLPSGMDLTNAAASHANLVGVESRQEAGTMRVAEFDADSSYLVHKIEGTHSTGSQMPLGGAPLERPILDAIRAWINSGAPQ